MPRLLTIGPRGFRKGVGVATLSFTPLFDRAAVVTRVFVDKQSADDTWIFSTSGQELARIPISASGHQQMLGGPASAVPRNSNIFDFARSVLGKPITYPVPQGLTFTVSSLGGATANISIEYDEVSMGDVRPGMMNAPDSQSWRLPIFLTPPTVTHAAGVAEDDYAGQVAPAFFPKLFGLVQIPAAWRFDIWALFAEGAGVNTFSGAANHQSTTDHVGLTYNGQVMLTRDALDGLTNIGQAAAAGSANTVYGADLGPYPAFQDLIWPEAAILDYPLVLMPGCQLHFLFGTRGDSTGGANYGLAYTAFLCDVNLTGMAPQ